MASSHKLISRGDWALIPLNEGVAFSVSWRQDGVSRREKYYLVESFWSSSQTFQDPRPAPVITWIAAIWYEARFSENLNELRQISASQHHVRGFVSVGTQGHWAKTQIGDGIFYGQNDAKYPTTRWLVYHPRDWKPTQANFLQGTSFSDLAFSAIPKAAVALTRYGLSMAAIPTAGTATAAAAALSATGMWDSAAKEVQEWGKNTLGHALHEFAAQEGQEAMNKEELADFKKRVVIFEAEVKRLELGLNKDQSETLAYLLAENDLSPTGYGGGYWNF